MEDALAAAVRTALAGLPDLPADFDPEAVAAGLQTDLDERGIAKNARQEKLAARDQMKQKAENDRMAALYRQHILKEEAPKQSGVIQIQGLGGKKRPEPVGGR